MSEVPNGPPQGFEDPFTGDEGFGKENEETDPVKPESLYKPPTTLEEAKQQLESYYSRFRSIDATFYNPYGAVKTIWDTSFSVQHPFDEFYERADTKARSYKFPGEHTDTGKLLENLEMAAIFIETSDDSQLQQLVALLRYNVDLANVSGPLVNSENAVAINLRLYFVVYEAYQPQIEKMPRP